MSVPITISNHKDCLTLTFAESFLPLLLNIIFLFNNTSLHVFSVIELQYFLKYADARRLAQRALITFISYPMVPGTLVTAYPLLLVFSVFLDPLQFSSKHPNQFCLTLDT